jgi:hypothetical protein
MGENNPGETNFDETVVGSFSVAGRSLTMTFLLRSFAKIILLRSVAEGELMANLKGLESIVSQLRVERTSLVNQLRHVDAALSVLGKLNNGVSYTKPRRRKLSVAARKKIAAAQRARWARVRQLKKAA